MGLTSAALWVCGSIVVLIVCVAAVALPFLADRILVFLLPYLDPVLLPLSLRQRQKGPRRGDEGQQQQQQQQQGQNHAHSARKLRLCIATIPHLKITLSNIFLKPSVLHAMGLPVQELHITQLNLRFQWWNPFCFLKLQVKGVNICVDTHISVEEIAAAVRTAFAMGTERESEERQSRGRASRAQRLILWDQEALGGGVPPLGGLLLTLPPLWMRSAAAVAVGLIVSRVDVQLKRITIFVGDCHKRGHPGDAEQVVDAREDRSRDKDREHLEVEASIHARGLEAVDVAVSAVVVHTTRLPESPECSLTRDKMASVGLSLGLRPWDLGRGVLSLSLSMGECQISLSKGAFHALLRIMSALGSSFKDLGSALAAATAAAERAFPGRHGSDAQRREYMELYRVCVLDLPRVDDVGRVDAWVPVAAAAGSQEVVPVSKGAKARERLQELESELSYGTITLARARAIPPEGALRPHLRQKMGDEKIKEGAHALQATFGKSFRIGAIIAAAIINLDVAYSYSYYGVLSMRMAQFIATTCVLGAWNSITPWAVAYACILAAVPLIFYATFGHHARNRKRMGPDIELRVSVPLVSVELQHLLAVRVCNISSVRRIIHVNNVSVHDARPGDTYDRILVHIKGGITADGSDLGAPCLTVTDVKVIVAPLLTTDVAPFFAFTPKEIPDSTLVHEPVAASTFLALPAGVPPPTPTPSPTSLQLRASVSGISVCLVSDPQHADESAVLTLQTCLKAAWLRPASTNVWMAEVGVAVGCCIVNGIDAALALSGLPVQLLSPEFGGSGVDAQPRCDDAGLNVGELESIAGNNSETIIRPFQVHVFAIGRRESTRCSVNIEDIDVCLAPSMLHIVNDGLSAALPSAPPPGVQGDDGKFDEDETEDKLRGVCGGDAKKNIAAVPSEKVTSPRSQSDVTGAGAVTVIELCMQQIHFRLVNDRYRRPIPWLKAQVQDLQLKLVVQESCTTVALKTLVSSEFYNHSLVVWEPLVEPWTVSASINQARDLVALHAESAIPLNVNVSHAAVASLCRSSVLFTDKRYRVKSLPLYEVCNETQFDVVLRAPHDARLHIGAASGSVVPFDFAEGIAPANRLVDITLGRDNQVSGISVSSMNRSLHQLLSCKSGRKLRDGSDATIDSSLLAPSPSAAGTFVDKSAWVKDTAVSACHACDRAFSVVRRKHHCRKCGAVFCDACSAFRIQGKRVCQQCLVTHHGDSAVAVAGAAAQVFVVCDVSMSVGGVKRLTLRSTLGMQNHTDYDVSWRCVNDHSVGGRLPANSSGVVWLPLGAPSDGGIQFSCEDDNDTEHATFSEQAARLMHYAGGKMPKALPMHTYFIDGLIVNRDARSFGSSGTVYHIDTPILVENLLPTFVRVRVSSRQVQSRGLGVGSKALESVLLHDAEVSTGKRSLVYSPSVSSSTSVELAMDLPVNDGSGNFLTCEPVALPEYRSVNSTATLFHCTFRNGVDDRKGKWSAATECSVRVHVEVVRRGGTVFFTLFSPFWVYNATGLRLDISNDGKLPSAMTCGEESNSDSLALPAQQAARAGDILDDSLLRPQLFSFAKNGSSSKQTRCYIRLHANIGADGAAVQAPPTKWSKGFALGAAGLAGHVTVPCKGGQFEIGVNVMTAPVPFQRTKRIVFAPRFIVHNACGQPLALSLCPVADTGRAVSKWHERDVSLATSVPAHGRIAHHTYGTAAVRAVRKGGHRLLSFRRTGSSAADQWNWSGWLDAQSSGDVSVNVRRRVEHAYSISQSWFVQFRVKQIGASVHILVEPYRVPRGVSFRSSMRYILPFHVENKSRFALVRFRQSGIPDSASFVTLSSLDSACYCWEEPMQKDPKLQIQLAPESVLESASHGADCGRIHVSADYNVASRTVKVRVSEVICDVGNVGSRVESTWFTVSCHLLPDPTQELKHESRPFCLPSGNSRHDFELKLDRWRAANIRSTDKLQLLLNKVSQPGSSNGMSEVVGSSTVSVRSLFDASEPLWLNLCVLGRVDDSIFRNHVVTTSLSSASSHGKVVSVLLKEYTPARRVYVRVEDDGPTRVLVVSDYRSSDEDGVEMERRQRKEAAAHRNNKESAANVVSRESAEVAAVQRRYKHLAKFHMRIDGMEWRDRAFGEHTSANEALAPAGSMESQGKRSIVDVHSNSDIHDLFFCEMRLKSAAIRTCEARIGPSGQAVWKKKLMFNAALLSLEDDVLEFSVYRRCGHHRGSADLHDVCVGVSQVRLSDLVTKSNKENDDEVVDDVESGDDGNAGSIVFTSMSVPVATAATIWIRFAFEEGVRAASVPATEGAGAAGVRSNEEVRHRHDDGASEGEQEAETVNFSIRLMDSSGLADLASCANICMAAWVHGQVWAKLSCAGSRDLHNKVQTVLVMDKGMLNAAALWGTDVTLSVEKSVLEGAYDVKGLDLVTLDVELYFLHSPEWALSVAGHAAEPNVEADTYKGFNQVLLGRVCVPLESLWYGAAPAVDHQGTKAEREKMKKEQESFLKEVMMWATGKWITVKAVDEKIELQDVCPRVRISIDGQPAQPEALRPTLRLSVTFPCFGVSIIDAQPQEFLYISVNGLTGIIEDALAQQTVQLSVGKLQIDNHRDHAAFPVILTAAPVKEENRQPMLQMSVNKIKDSDVPVHQFGLFSFLLQMIDVSIEENLLWDMLDEVSELMAVASTPASGGNGVGGMVYDEESVSQALWVETCLSRREILPSSLIDPRFRSAGISTTHVYFHLLQLQPIAVNFSFAASPNVSARKTKNTQGALLSNSFFVDMLLTALSTVGAVAGTIDAAPIRLNGKVFEHASGTTETLVGSLISHYTVQVLQQVYKVLGSFEFLGNPVSLAGNLGDGVMDFFYEPAKGLVTSPQAFGKGLAKGSSSLVSHALGGVFGAASKITGSVGKGVAVLSMDASFIASRQRPHGHHPEHLGDGLLGGAQALSSGVFQGLAGVITDPLKGARDGGFGGFVRGVGRGLVGAVAKPVAGAIDLTSQTLSGLGNTAGFVFGDRPTAEGQVRPRRVIGEDGALTVYNRRIAEEAARAADRDKDDDAWGVRAITQMKV